MRRMNNKKLIKQSGKKLVVAKESLRSLSDEELGTVAGRTIGGGICIMMWTRDMAYYQCRY